MNNMNIRIPYIVSLFALFALVACETGPIASDPPEARNTAMEGLETFKALAAFNPETEGFSSESEVKAATLGTGTNIHYMHVDQVAQHNEGNDPEALIKDGNEWMYEVLLNGEAKAAIIVRWVEGNWEVAQMGNSALIKALSEVKNQHMQENNMTPEAYRLVRIPGMYHYWISFQDQGETYFVQAFERPEYGHQKHDVISASEMLSTIAEAAQNFESAIQEP